MLQIKYVLAVRCDMSSKLLSKVYPSVFDCIKSDDVDDVVGVACASLVPVAACLVFGSSSSIDAAALTEKLWDSLAELDDLTSSTQSILQLLSELIHLRTDSDPGCYMEDSKTLLSVMVGRLFPFLSHVSSQVCFLDNLSIMSSDRLRYQTFRRSGRPRSAPCGRSLRSRRWPPTSFRRWRNRSCCSSSGELS